MIINHSHIGKIGDTVILEPVLFAHGERTGDHVHLHVAPWHCDYFLNHPHITAYPEPLPNADAVLSVDNAFFHSHEHKAPFTAGFWHQLGLELRPTDRLHYKSFFVGPRPAEATPNPYTNSIIIIPNAYSCSSRNRTSGSKRLAARPNIQPPHDWWKNVLRDLPGPIFALMGDNPRWDHDFPHAQNVRGLSALGLLRALASCKLLITPETGPLHLASTNHTPTLFLSCATPVNFCEPSASTPHEVVRAGYADEFSQTETIEKVWKLLNEQGQAPR